MRHNLWMYTAWAAGCVVALRYVFPVSRWFFKECVRLCVLLDLACVRFVRVLWPPKYVLLGACDQRGACCKQIVGNPPQWFKKRAWCMRMFVAYHGWAHRFECVGKTQDGAVVFSCGHLQRDGRCGIYRYRPRICRDYPVLGWTKPPSLLPGCGYRVAARSVTRMKPRASLRVLNAYVDVHHPTPDRTGRQPWEQHVEDYIHVERPFV